MRGAIIVGVLFSLAACGRTFEKTATQPNPLITPSETLRNSEKITIVTGDMDLKAPAPAETVSTTKNASPIHNHMYPLFNQASFTMVSRDRLRFHVQVDHKWEEWANPASWQVDLVDDKGRHWVPEATEHVRTKIMTTMWDQEIRSQICDNQGRDGRDDCINTVAIADDGWRNRQALGNISVYRGNADFVFYDRDLMTRDIKWLKLSVHRSGEAFEFTWRFQDTVAASE